MNALVFATYDLTPQDWSDFAKSTAIPPDATGAEPITPFILVRSRSQRRFDVETGFTIQSSIKTEFPDASWDNIKSTFAELAEPHSSVVHTTYLLILDEQSKHDRKAVIVHKSEEYRAAGGTIVDPSIPSKEERIKFIVWKRHRVPFEEVFMTYSLLSVDGDLDEEPYLERVDREPA